MNGDCVEIGEKVRISVNAEDRGWGYNPAPNDTVCEVLGFGQIVFGRNQGHKKPGVYQNCCWLRLLLPNGNELEISESHVEAVDQATYKARLAARMPFAKQVYLAPLPHTSFWEGDLVLYSSQRKHSILPAYIKRINFNGLLEDKDDHKKIYLVNLDGQQVVARACELTLFARGNIWKHYHRQPVSFSTFEDEINFHHEIGQTDQVPLNSGYYSGTEREAFDMILDNKADSFAPDGQRDRAYRFTDRSVGERVRAHTLRQILREKINAKAQSTSV